MIFREKTRHSRALQGKSYNRFEKVKQIKGKVFVLLYLIYRKE